MELQDICFYVKERIKVSELTQYTYISTENMLPNKSGITKATNLPNVETTTSFKKGDILVSNIRPYFKKIWQASFDGGCSGDVLVFRSKQGFSQKFLHYVLANDAFFDYSMKSSKGTKMPRGDKESIMKYFVPDFSLQIQEKIAHILFSLDSKIENNNQINNNLEEQAKTIYTSFFKDFEPYNNKRPFDWFYGTIKDLAENIICGKTPSTKIEEYYGNDIPFITIPDMHNNTYVVKTERYLSNLGANSQKNKFLPLNSICVSCIGTAGLVSLVSKPSQTNQQINSLIPKEKYSPYYVYFAMKSLSETINSFGQSGSTIVNLNKEQFSKLSVLIPSTEAVAQFNSIVEPMFNTILLKQQENLNLSSLRDTLLPKLMSGELDVSELEL